jgi:hypothetical protein
VEMLAAEDLRDLATFAEPLVAAIKFAIDYTGGYHKEVEMFS